MVAKNQREGLVPVEKGGQAMIVFIEHLLCGFPVLFIYSLQIREGGI